LGIDIGDIAVIVQHKLPLSRESFLQRVGRAGRSKNTYRIATGIVILQSTPFASLYMFSSDLRNLLFNAGYSSLLNSIDFINAQIILQYIFSYFLLKRAINKFKTCVGDKNNEKCETILKELVEDIDRNLNEYSSELQNALCINLDSIKNDIRNLIDKLKIIINSDVEGEDNNCKSIAEGLKEDINNALSETYEVINELNESEIEKIISNKKYILSIVHKIYNKIEQLNDVVYNSSTSINQIKEIIKSIELNAEEINSYIGSLEKNKSKLKSTNNLLERMRIKKDLNNLDKTIDRLRKAYESIKDLVRDLNDIIADNSVKKCLTTFRYFNKTSPNNNKNKDIFSIIREKSANDIFIDLLLTPPSPSIELKSVEEADDNE
jgi:superfamily II DNA helicase RecQ